MFVFLINCLHNTHSDLRRLTVQVLKNPETSSPRYTGRQWRTVVRLVWMSWISYSDKNRIVYTQKSLLNKADFKQSNQNICPQITNKTSLMQSDKWQTQSGLTTGSTYGMCNYLFTCSSWIFKFSARASAVFPVFDAFCLNKVISRGR